MRPLINLTLGDEKPTVFKKLVGGNRPFYIFSILNKVHNIRSSGSDVSQGVAKNKAICEFVERLFLKEVKNDPERKRVFRFSELYSTDCLACGLVKEMAEIRAYREALERHIRLLIENKRILLGPMKFDWRKEFYFHPISLEYIDSSFFVGVTCFDGITQRGNLEFVMCSLKFGELGFTGFSVNSNQREAGQHAFHEAERQLLNKLIFEGRVNKTNFDSVPSSNESEYLKYWNEIVKHLVVSEKVGLFPLPKVTYSTTMEHRGLFISRYFFENYEKKVTTRDLDKAIFA